MIASLCQVSQLQYILSISVSITLFFLVTLSPVILLWIQHSNKCFCMSAMENILSQVSTLSIESCTKCPMCKTTPPFIFLCLCALTKHGLLGHISNAVINFTVEYVHMVVEIFSQWYSHDCNTCTNSSPLTTQCIVITVGSDNLSAYDLI